MHHIHFCDVALGHYFYCDGIHLRKTGNTEAFNFKTKNTIIFSANSIVSIKRNF